MQKSEWASWVQAIGSMGAIIGAAWVAGYQERKRVLAHRQAAISRARTFAGSLMGAAEGVRLRGGVVLSHVRGMRVVLEEIVQDSRAIAFENLDLSWIAAISSLRSIAVQMTQALRDAEAVDGKSGDFELVNTAKYRNMERIVAELESKAQQFVDVLGSDHPGVQMHTSTASNLSAAWRKVMQNLKFS